MKHALIRIFAAALLLIASSAAALASNCSSFTYTLTNGTTADANQVMSNFNTLLNCANSNLAHNGANSDITSLSGLATPLSVPQGGTNLGTLTAHSVLLGEGTSSMGSATIGTAGNVLTDNGASADPTFQAPVTSNTLTNSLSGDVTINNASNYFAGPTVAQGTTGKWCASGTVTVLDSATSFGANVKLWDGTTVIASAVSQNANVGAGISVALSGCISSPAGNIRMDVKTGTTTGVIKFNLSGNSKDSTLTAWRVQ